jgi:hypothetical protein
MFLSALTKRKIDIDRIIGSEIFFLYSVRERILNEMRHDKCRIEYPVVNEAYPSALEKKPGLLSSIVAKAKILEDGTHFEDKTRYLEDERRWAFAFQTMNRVVKYIKVHFLICQNYISVLVNNVC